LDCLRNIRIYSISTGFPPFPQNELKSTEGCEEIMRGHLTKSRVLLYSLEVGGALKLLRAVLIPSLAF